MRKQNKIISLILVVAMLCSLVVFVPAAAADGNTSSASAFAPTAAWASAENSNEAVSSASDNIAGSASHANWNEDSISAHLVTPANGDGKYITLVAETDKATANHFINVGVKSKVALDFTKDYYVIEMDLASESGIINQFTINPIIAFSGATSGTRLDPNPSDLLGNHAVLSDGDWHHYAMVGNLATNTLSIYIDGELVATKAAYNATNKATQDAADASTVYYVDTVRVNIAGNAAMTKGTSLSIDNVAISVGTSGAYATAPAAESLPAVASINGENYSSVVAINNRLSSVLPADVQILRDFAGTVTVNCDATVATNNCLGSVVAGADVTVSADGVYDAPHRSSVTDEDASSASTSTIFNATSVSGVKSYGGSTNYSATTVVPYLVSAAGSANTYLDIRPGASFSTTDSTHNHFNWYSTNTVYEAGKYTIIDYDLYAEAEYMTNAYIGITSRDASGSNKGGVSYYPAQLGLETGKWNHITCIGDFDNNVLYIYVNNKLAKTIASGVYNGMTDTTGAYFQGIRLNVSTKSTLTADQNLAIDNVAYRMNVADSWIAANLGASDLYNWTDRAYDGEYELPVVPVLATVDGVAVYSASELSAMLFGNNAKVVELYRPYKGTVTVTCDATVETNGYGVPVAGKDEIAVSNNGTVYTFDAPFQQSISSVEVTQNADIINAIKANKSGNLFSSITNLVQPTNGMKSEIVTNTLQSGNYFKVSPNGTENNAYLELDTMTTITPNSNTQFYVLDMDFAILDSSVTVAFMPVPRYNDSGLWGASNPSMNQVLAGYTDGEMQHVTVVVNIDTNTKYFFVNGNLVLTQENGYTSAANHTTYFAAGSAIRFDGFRIGSNLGGVGATNVDDSIGYILDNVNIQYIEDAATGYAADSLSAAMASGSLSIWGDAVTEIATQAGPLATVDGEYVCSASALNALLAKGRAQKEVVILRDESKTITVSVDAKVETNGLNVTLVAGSGVSSSTNGTVTTFDAPWQVAAEQTAVSYGNFIIDTTVPNNLFTAYASKNVLSLINNDANGLGMYKVTDNSTGNTYLKLQPLTDSVTTKNIYLSAEFISQPAVGDSSAAAVLQDGQGYYVHDFDIATDSQMIADATFGHIARNNASEGSTFPFGASIPVGTYDVSDGEWTHVTIIGDLAANKQYVFINGVCIGEAGYANQNNGQYDLLNIKGARMINISVGANISRDQTILLDNVAVRAFKTNNDSGDLASAIAAGTLAGWKNNVYDGNDELPVIATVNGVDYNKISELTQALTDGKDNVVSIEREIVASVVAASTATIKTNGLANFISAANGFNMVDNNDGTYTIVLETRFGSITVNINGAPAIVADVLYGTDIAEYLNKNNSYVFNVISDDNGQVYSGASWDVTPTGYVDGDEVYNVTATAFAGDILVLDATSGSVLPSVTDIKTAFTTRGANYIVVMNSNYEFDANLNPNSFCTVYMAGHAITFAESTGASHAFTVGSTAKLEFINGDIIDNVRSNTQALFFLNYDFANEIKVVNSNIYAVGNLGAIRGGTITIENCDVDILEMQNGYGFQLAEYYNAGYTYNKCTLNIIDSDVSYRHFTRGRTERFVNIKAYEEWNGTIDESVRATAVSKGADKLVHEINFSGSTMNLSFGAAMFNTNSDKIVINIDNSMLNIKQLYANMAGTINIGDNVVSGTPLTGVNFGAGVVLVNSGNPEAPYAYANEYATVTWSDGTVERWLDGTYPANANCKTDAVVKVEAGNSYTFAAVDGFALTMKANLTLDANLKFNVYIPTAAGVTAVEIAGVAYDVASAEVVTVSGVQCYKFVYEIAPYYAAASFAIVLTTADYTVAREIDFVEYADLVAAAYADNAVAINLVKAILQYVAEAHYNMATYLDGYDAAANYSDADSVTVDESTAVDTMSNVSAYITSAQLNLAAAPKWRFNVADGADISNLVIKVDGVEVEYVICDGYVEVELSAYDMIDTITVAVGGATGTYNFAAYYAAQNALASSIDPSTTSWKAGTNIEEGVAYFYMDLLNAFYTYAYYAAAYNA